MATPGTVNKRVNFTVQGSSTPQSGRLYNPGMSRISYRLLQGRKVRQAQNPEDVAAGSKCHCESLWADVPSRHLNLTENARDICGDACWAMCSAAFLVSYRLAAFLLYHHAVKENIWRTAQKYIRPEGLQYLFFLLCFQFLSGIVHWFFMMLLPILSVSSGTCQHCERVTRRRAYRGNLIMYCIVKS
jgi:hypothetical protein